MDGWNRHPRDGCGTGTVGEPFQHLFDDLEMLALAGDDEELRLFVEFDGGLGWIFRQLPSGLHGGDDVFDAVIGLEIGPELEELHGAWGRWGFGTNTRGGWAG